MDPYYECVLNLKELKNEYKQKQWTVIRQFVKQSVRRQINPLIIKKQVKILKSIKNKV